MNTKESKKNNAEPPNAENKKKVTSKPSKPVEPSPENDEEQNNSSESDWEPMSSDSEDEYTEEDMERYLRAFNKNILTSSANPGPPRPELFYPHYFYRHFEETRQHLKNKKKASSGEKKATKKATAKERKKKFSKIEEKVQAALLKIMPNMFKTHAKVMARRILKAKPINHELIKALRAILKGKHREHKVNAKPDVHPAPELGEAWNFMRLLYQGGDLEPEQAQILHLLQECAKGYRLTHVSQDLVKEFLSKGTALKNKQMRLERLAQKAAGGDKTGK